MDSDTFAVLTTLGIDFLIGFLIFLGWIIIRRFRGEKKGEKKEDLDKEHEILFDQHIDESKLEKVLEQDESQHKIMHQESIEWRMIQRDNLILELQDSKTEPLELVVEDQKEDDDDEGDRYKVDGDNLDADMELTERLLIDQDEEEKDELNQLDSEGNTQAQLDEKEEQNNIEERKRNLKQQIIRKFSIIKSALKLNQNKEKPQGILDWLKILRTIDDDDLKAITGTDTALYLVFIRMAAKFFFVLMILNLAVFVPIYLTGSPSDSSDVRDTSGNLIYIKLFTVLNITGVPAKMISVYVMMNILYTGFALVFIFFYWKKSIDWRYRKHSHKDPFKDHDIALHSVIIQNLPITIPAQKMSQILKNVFNKIFPEARVISARALLKLDELYKKAVQLRDYKKNYRYYKKLNEESVDFSKKTIKVRKGCFRGSQKYDAEDYYKDKIIQKSREIRENRRKLNRYNGGLGFVTFLSNLQVKKCLYKNEFRTLVMEHLTPQERLDSMALQWQLKQAPSQSDIIWENIYFNDGHQEVKSWFLLVMLFVVCVILVTPVSLIDNLTPLIDAITNGLGETSFVSTMIQTYSSTLILLVFNSGIVPLFIDLVAFLEGHKTKSSKQLGIMRKNFFFQLMNTVLLQLTASATILGFIQIFQQNLSWTELTKSMSKNLVNLFFLRYAIQLAFVTNGIQLLDIPHHSIKLLKYMMYKQSIKKEINPKPFVDDFAFDLGYYQSQAIVCFALGIIFSGTMPLVSVFGFLFFGIKYFIDKYNLTFAYNKEFEGGGVIKKQVLPFMFMSIYLFQLLNLGYFAIQDDSYFTGGIAFIAVETIALISLNIYYNNKKREARDQLAKFEENENCDNLEDVEKKEEEIDGNAEDSKDKSKIMKFIDGNLLKGTERRLTLATTSMSHENIRKLKEAYKHPFDKIPREYFITKKRGVVGTINSMT